MVIDILLWGLITILLMAAFVFTALPLMLPGIILTMIAAVIFVAWKGLAELGVLNFSIIFGLGALYLLADWLGGIWGAKKVGASKYGLIGSIVGAMLGVFIGGPIGVVLGTLLGAMLFEIVFNREEFKKAFKIGLGAAIGFLLGTLGKLIAVAIATGIFIWGILS